MNKRILIISLIVLAVITFITSISTIVGFFTNNLNLIINSARFLSLSSLILMTVFGRSVYLDKFGEEEDIREVRMELTSKEDVEKFRRKLEKELRKYVDKIEERDRLNKENKDE